MNAAQRARLIREAQDRQAAAEREAQRLRRRRVGRGLRERIRDAWRALVAS
jgi:hypothetical protein